AAVDDRDVDGPEKEETGELRRVDAQKVERGTGGERREKDTEDFVDGFATYPRLDAEPATGDEGAEDGWDVGAAGAEGGAAVDGKRDAVAGAGMGVEHHGDQHDE